MSKERLDNLIEHVKATAMKHREEKGFSHNLAPLAICIGPNGEQATVPTPFKDLSQKAAMMKALSKTARASNVIAIILIGDTFTMSRKKFNEHYKVPENLTNDEWIDLYISIVKDTGGNIANLPKELLTDAILVSVKGPAVREVAYFLPYHEGVGDSVRWDEPYPPDYTEIFLLDDWWDAVTVH